jgi:hypothetical protein
MFRGGGGRGGLDCFWIVDWTIDEDQHRARGRRTKVGGREMVLWSLLHAKVLTILKSIARKYQRTAMREVACRPRRSALLPFRSIRSHDPISDCLGRDGTQVPSTKPLERVETSVDKDLIVHSPAVQGGWIRFV